MAMLVIEGRVGKGSQRGKNLGFPTANIALGLKIPSGIYISETLFEGRTYPSLTFIGQAETFGSKIYQSETYILGNEPDLYGKIVKVELIKKIRESKKFKNQDELIEAMKKDEEKARQYFKLT